MAPKDGDENGPGRRPRVNQPAVADGQGPADWSDGEDDVDDDIVNNDDAEENTDDDSEDSEDNGDENEDIIAHLQYIQLQREDLRRQELITENAELTADKMEAEVTLVEEQDETDKIREDIRRIEVQIERLKSEAPILWI